MRKRRRALVSKIRAKFFKVRIISGLFLHASGSVSDVKVFMIFSILEYSDLNISSLNLVFIRMDKPSETDIEIKEPEECIHNLTLNSEECAQKDNDTSWTTVRKRTTHHFRIPHEITNEAFESAMVYPFLEMQAVQ
jgi:hypothetical protein